MGILNRDDFWVADQSYLSSYWDHFSESQDLGYGGEKAEKWNKLALILCAWWLLIEKESISRSNLPSL